MGENRAIFRPKKNFIKKFEQNKGKKVFASNNLYEQFFFSDLKDIFFDSRF